MEYIVYDGEVISGSDWHISLTDRAFRYGDGFFERVALQAGRLCFWEEHWQRIQKAAELFALSISPGESACKQQLLKLAEKSGISNGKFRMQFWRKGGGLYTPETMDVHSLFTLEPAEENLFAVKTIRRADIYPLLRKPVSPLFSVKGLHAMPYILASLWRKENNLEEAILLNELGRICEGSRASIFIVKKGEGFTPPLSEGPVDGVVRSVLLKGGLAKEKPIEVGDLFEGEEIFLTNVSGIYALSEWQTKPLGTKKAEQCSAFLTDILR